MTDPHVPRTSADQATDAEDAEQVAPQGDLHECLEAAELDSVVGGARGINAGRCDPRP